MATLSAIDARLSSRAGTARPRTLAGRHFEGAACRGEAMVGASDAREPVLGERKTVEQG